MTRRALQQIGPSSQPATETSRRRFLEATGTAVGGVSTLTGCLAAFDSDDDGENDDGGPPRDDGDQTDDGSNGGDGAPGEIEWTHGIGGRIDAVTEGLVLGTENFAADDADGGVYALDATTGTHRWTHGETGGYHMFTDLTVDDAIYVGFGDDAIGSGSGETIALEFDGTVRWTQPTGSVYSRPMLSENTVFVGDDTGAVRALDRADGEELWVTDGLREESPEPISVEAVGIAVYATAEDLYALDRDDGDVVWSFEDPDGTIRNAFLATAGSGDGALASGTDDSDVAFVSTSEGITAVADGEAVWTQDVESNASVRGLAAGTVFVSQEDGLTALDTADGAERWTRDVPQSVLHVSEDVVYTGDETLVAFALEDGSRLFELDHPQFTEFRTVVDGPESDVFVQGGPRLGQVDAEGDLTWHTGFESPIGSLVAGDGVLFVGTDEDIHAVRHQ